MVNPDELDALVDDYLRLVSRTHPWSRTLHGEVLEAFVAWVREAGRGTGPGSEGEQEEPA